MKRPTRLMFLIFYLKNHPCLLDLMCIKSKTYLAIYQTSKMGFFEKAFSGFKPITNSTESSALDF